MSQSNMNLFVDKVAGTISISGEIIATINPGATPTRIDKFLEILENDAESEIDRLEAIIADMEDTENDLRDETFELHSEVATLGRELEDLKEQIEELESKDR